MRRLSWPAETQPDPDAASSRVPTWAHVLWLAVLLLVDALQLYSRSFDKRAPALVLTDWPPLLLRALLTDLLASAVFYTNWKVLIPRTLGRSRLAPYILGVLGLLLLYVPLRLVLSWLLKGAAEENGNMTGNWLALTVPYTIMGLMCIFVSSALKVTGDYLQAQQNRRELEKQQLVTELSLLKMQVNPHFLFNTLNNIYSLASQKSDRAPEAVLRLAEIMRYMLYESSADTVPLAKELSQLRSFLDLQSLRLPGAAPDAIRWLVPDKSLTATCPIAPMLLLPLVENAFKHGDLTARPAVEIELTLPAPHELRFVVRNQVASKLPQLSAEPGGVGLTNLRRRLALLYAGRYTLRISEDEATYQAELTLHTA